MTPRQYDLFLTRTQKFAVGMPLLMLILLPLFFLLLFNAPGPPEAPLFRFVPLLFLIIFFGLYASATLYLPYRISVTRDRQLVFKSVLRTQAVRVGDLSLHELKQANPALQTKGC